MYLIATGLLFGLLAISLDLIWGYSGILNLAPAVSFGVGAYAWGLVTKDMSGLGATYLALLVAVVVAAVLAAVVAFVSLRAGAKGIYFALITLALGLAMEQGARAWYSVTGGSNGIIGIPMPTLGIPGVETTFDTPVSFYLMTVVVVGLAFTGCGILVKHRLGTILEAIRESEPRAATLGYSTLGFRVLISSLSGAIGGLAGALYAPLTGIVDPAVFGVALSVQVFVWVAVGGQATLIGPLLAAVAITIGQSELSGSAGSAYLLVIGALFIAIVLLLPGGLASLGTRLRFRALATRARRTPDSAEMPRVAPPKET
jgi:ABC-type branched-subunit amino acid transport system permease subunit